MFKYYKQRRIFFLLRQKDKIFLNRKNSGDITFNYVLWYAKYFSRIFHKLTTKWDNKRMKNAWQDVSKKKIRSTRLVRTEANDRTFVINSIAIFCDSLEYPFHHFLLPHEIRFQKEFFESHLPFIPPIIIKSWIQSLSTDLCNW